MLNFLANSMLLLFGFWTPVMLGDLYPRSNIKYFSLAIFFVLILTSGIILFISGPNSLAFGIFIGSGWKILNFILDNSFISGH